MNQLCAEDFSLDEAQKGPAHYSSALLRQRLIDVLKSDSYEEHVGAMCRQNQALALQLRRVTQSTTKVKIFQASGCDFGPGGLFCSDGVEFLISMMARQRNSKVNHFLPAAVSLVALRCNVPVMFWNIIARTGLIYSKTVAEEIALELGKQLMPSQPIPGAVGCHVSFDNLAKYKRTLLEHADGDRQNHMIESNQWTFINGPSLMLHQVELGESGEWAQCVSGTEDKSLPLREVAPLHRRVACNVRAIGRVVWHNGQSPAVLLREFDCQQEVYDHEKVWMVETPDRVDLHAGR